MQHPDPPEHARHDTTLIAGHAAGDLTDIERARADALIAECGECGELRRDLVAIAAATRSVPAPLMLAGDFRLAPEQAERLRRGSWLRAFLRPFGATRSLRPMAAAFTSLGVVGLVVGMTMSSVVPAGGRVTSGQDMRENVPAPANPQAPASTQSAAGTFRSAAGYEVELDDGRSLLPVLTATDGAYALGATKAPRQTVLENKSPWKPGPTAVQAAAGHEGGQGAGDASSEGRDVAAPLEAQAPPPSLLIAGSLALLGIGLLLFGLGITSRRVR